MKILVIFVFLILFVIPVNQATAEQATDALPAFTLKDLKGRTVRLSDYKGKVVLVNFWATWCVPCLAEMPELVKLQKEYKGSGLQIIGVTYEAEAKTLVSRLARKFKINYPLLFGTTDLSKQYGIEEVLPVTLVVDREGKLRDRILGVLDMEEFDEKIKPMLE
ncbi:MAG: TlpA disulfide reductase family protein [Acidobacteriota bacterium]